MNIKDKALKFAIEAHRGQVRKSDPIKPMIIHPINVGHILEEYGFDDNVVAAGYLHDVVEDTKYTSCDILDIFGEDIWSLVNGASESDKSMSWEDRKKETIKKVKTLDIRHKAIVAADKISNLEDLMTLFEINGKYDFSKFNRGYDEQKWYYENVFKSIVYKEDKSNPMFIRLKGIIDHIFGEKSDNYIKDVIFKDKFDEYNILNKLNYRNREILKLNSVLPKKVPYVIEFTGTPRTGKTTLINNLYDFFKKVGFKVSIVEEFTTSSLYKTKIYPKLKNEYKKVVNFEIPKYVSKQLDDELNKDLDIIIVDRCLIDRVIWVDRLFLKKGITKEEYNEYKDLYLPKIKSKIDICIATYTDSITAIRRDYSAYLSLEERHFLNEDNVNEYNKSLNNISKLCEKEDINLNIIDTTDSSVRDCSIKIADIILNDIKNKYVEILNENYM